jgi:hypothetical protein
MLRLLVLVLVLANAGFYAWTQGWLAPLLPAQGQGEREPDRLARQVHPERVRVLEPASAATGSGNESPRESAAAPVCLELGPFSTAEVASAEAALQKVVPLGRYSSIKNETPAVWIVYMGRYNDRETLQKKTDELKKLKISFEELRDVPELGDGLSLGRYPDAAAAEQGLADVTARGVRTARVAQLSSANASHTLRIDQADAALQAKLQSLSGPDLHGRSAQACPR